MNQEQRDTIQHLTSPIRTHHRVGILLALLLTCLSVCTTIALFTSSLVFVWLMLAIAAIIVVVGVLLQLSKRSSV